MHKYLICILFGIILFILWNNNDGFNIGCPGEGDPCDESLDEQCEEHLACVDGTCRSAAGGGGGGGAPKDVKDACAAQLEERCPSLMDDEVYRTILWKKKPNVDRWDKRCFILFRDRIEYYKGAVIKGTILFDSINSTEIIPVGKFNYLNIITNARTYVLWAGEYKILKSSIEDLPTLQKFKNKLIQERMRISLFTSVSLEEGQLEIIQYYDLYTLCVSITDSVMKDTRQQRQFPDLTVVHQNIIDKLTPKILDKGFSIEPIPYLHIANNDYRAITIWPVLLKITGLISRETIYLLNLMPGATTTTLNFYIAAKKVKQLLLSNLDLPIDKLIIVGHSSGAALLLLLVINLVEDDAEGRLRKSIKSIMCIASGLGLCDTFIVDAFESIIKEKSEYITYYDIINMSGLPKDDDCWLDYFLDSFLLNITIISEYCIIGIPELCKGILPIDLGGIDLSVIPNEEEILAHLEATSKSIIEDREEDSPPNYTSYKDIIIENLHDYYSRCTANVSPDSRTIYDCKDLLRLFHKHININTLVILPGPYGGLFSYDKDTFLNSVLLEGPWTREYKEASTILGVPVDPIITYSEGVLCFSGIREPIKPSNYNEETHSPPQSEWTPEFGAHTLKSYNVRLQDLR